MAQLESSSVTFDIFFLNRLTKFSDTKAENDIQKCFEHFTILIQSISKYFPKELNEMYEKDLRSFKEKRNEIIKKTNVEEQSKKAQIEALKIEFIEAYSRHIFYSLDKVGVQKISMIGEIKFSKLSIDTIATIARDTSGLASAVKKTVERAG